MTKPKANQRGATLVVVLVFLVVMTFLGLGAMNDTNLQLAMVRNSQLQTGVYTVALTEINAQLDAINNNAEADTDQIILDLVQSATVINNGLETRSLTSDSAGDGTDDDFALLLGDVLGADANHYTTDIIIREPNANSFLPVTGMSLSPDSTVKWLIMEFDSTASITSTSTQSQQVQGFRYLSAN